MTAPWWESEALAWDTESTGIDVQTDRIVTIALVRLGTGKPTRESYLINPGVEIPAAATAVHGITTDQAIANGCKPADALDTAAEILASAMSRGVPVIGMNCPYDFTLFHFDCLRHSVPRCPLLSSRTSPPLRRRPTTIAIAHGRGAMVDATNRCRRKRKGRTLNARLCSPCPPVVPCKAARHRLRETRSRRDPTTDTRKRKPRRRRHKWHRKPRSATRAAPALKRRRLKSGRRPGRTTREKRKIRTTGRSACHVMWPLWLSS